MKQEILTLERGLLADTLVSLKESHRKISRFMQKHHPLLNGGVRRYIENSRNANQCAAYDICQHFPFLYINAGKPYRLFIASKAQYVTTCLHLV